jgi:Tfp pilus assembly protein PilX
MTATGCTPACWTPVPCPGCGGQLPPRGRSVPLETGIAGCCDEARMNPAVNPRHLWRENEDAERCAVCGDDAEAECAVCERPLCGDHRRTTSTPGDSFCQPGVGCQA